MLNTSKGNVTKYERISENNIHQSTKSYFCKSLGKSAHDITTFQASYTDWAGSFWVHELQPLIATPSIVILTEATISFSKCSKPNLKVNVCFSLRRNILFFLPSPNNAIALFCITHYNIWGNSFFRCFIEHEYSEEAVVTASLCCGCSAASHLVFQNQNE